MSASSMIAFDQYTLQDARQRTLLSLSLAVTEPGVVGIVGPQGAGKSLLLAALAGRLPRGVTASGTLQVAGGPLPKERVEPPLGPGAPPLRGTLLRVLTHPGPVGTEVERRVNDALRISGLWEEFQGRLSHPVSELTEAERRMLLACRALVRRAPYLLIDDATVDLDPDEADRFRQVITAIGEEIPVFWVSRAFRRVAPTAKRLIVLSGGKVLADGAADHVAVSPPQEAQDTLAAATGSSAGMALESLYHDLLTLGSKAERAIHMAVQSLTGQNLTIAREVIDGRFDIYQRKLEIHQRALGLIARTAPVSRDLRVLTTVIEAATDLGRIADHAINISEVTLAIGEDPLIKPLIDIPRMAEKAQEMVRHSLDAMVRRDVELARTVCEADKGVDALYRELFEELLGFITDGGDAYRAGQALYLLFVARYLERVADHASNIAEHVIFMVDGRREQLRLKCDDDGLPHPFLPG